MPIMNLSNVNRAVRALMNASRLPAYDSPPFDWDWQQRRDSYARWDSMYDNSAYRSQADGGLREQILEEIGETDHTKPLNGYFEPIAPIVDVYQQCLRGKLGQEIKIQAEEDGGDISILKRPIKQIWKWSNLNEKKDVISYLAACHGTVGLRIEARAEAEPGATLDTTRQRVRINVHEAGHIVDFDEDAQGNIQSVLLEYQVMTGGLGEARSDTVVIRELLSKTRMVKYRDDKKVEDIPNELGVCPFVLLRHRDNRREYGIPAHWGTELPVHLINYLLTRFGLSVDRHVFAKWFASASGPPPTAYDLGDTTVAYTQTQPGDSKPTLEAVVAKLDYMGMWQVVQGLIAHVRHRQPELTLAYLESLSGQSGETIAKLLIPCEERIYAARNRYENAIIKALQIGLSWGILMGLWDLGTGMGSKRAADAAYQSGAEDFRFNERPALPPTAYDRQKRAEADTKELEITARALRDLDGVLPHSEKLRVLSKVLGYDESKIESMLKEIREQDIVPPLDQ